MPDYFVIHFGHGRCKGFFRGHFFGVRRMTAEQIQQIKEKYKNPLYMKQAINSVAGAIADECIKQEMNIEVDGDKMEREKTEIKKTRFEELEFVLLNQIEMLNDDSILTDKEVQQLPLKNQRQFLI